MVSMVVDTESISTVIGSIPIGAGRMVERWLLSVSLMVNSAYNASNTCPIFPKKTRSYSFLQSTVFFKVFIPS